MYYKRANQSIFGNRQISSPWSGRGPRKGCPEAYIFRIGRPSNFLLAVRRMIFLYTILKIHDDEITQKVYLCQKRDPLPGDLCNMVSKDFFKMSINMTDDQILQMTALDYKKLIKSKVLRTAYDELEQLKQGHSNVRDNIYTDLKHIGPYFLNRNISNRQMSILFLLRSKSLRSIKSNFPKMKSSILCPRFRIQWGVV